MRTVRTTTATDAPAVARLDAHARSDGLGQKLMFDADRVVPEKEKTLHKGAVAPWSRSRRPRFARRSPSCLPMSLAPRS